MSKSISHPVLLGKLPQGAMRITFFEIFYGYLNKVMGVINL